MKKKTYIISDKSKRSRVSLSFWGLIAFLMYYFGASGFWWGIYAVVATTWIVAGISISWNAKEVDLFDENGKIRKDLLP